MGCNVSRLDGHAITLPPRLRPLFLQRLNEIRARRHGVGPLKDTTPSKKELLHDKDEDDNVSSHNPSPNLSKRMLVYSEEANVKETEASNTHDVVKEERSRGNGENDTKESTIEVAKAKIKHEGGNGEDDKKERGIGDAKENIENVFTEDEDEDEDEDDERMIGHEDDESFPGSPSFRVYFKDDEEDGHNDIGKNVAFKETASSDDGLSSKESSKKSKVKKGRKRRSFRLAKGGQTAVMNLLNVKSCYTSSHSSHHHTRLITEKTPT